MAHCYAIIYGTCRIHWLAKPNYRGLTFSTRSAFRAEENPHPGMLSDSYMLAVSYTEGDKTLKEVSWFVKVI